MVVKIFFMNLFIFDNSIYFLHHQLFLGNSVIFYDFSSFTQIEFVYAHVVTWQFECLCANSMILPQFHLFTKMKFIYVMVVYACKFNDSL